MKAGRLDSYGAVSKPPSDDFPSIRGVENKWNADWNEKQRCLHKLADTSANHKQDCFELTKALDTQAFLSAQYPENSCGKEMRNIWH